ncbi:MAG: hypothetical protein HY824_00085 [Acidobacteria bacterium]|nr:hypothetical protein [Acidobacteriota bacterium]
MRRWMSAMAAAGICVGCGGGQAGTLGTAAAEKGARETAPAPAAPAYREVTLPQGTALRLRLRSAVASDTSRV